MFMFLVVSDISLLKHDITYFIENWLCLVVLPGFPPKPLTELKKKIFKSNF